MEPATQNASRLPGCTDKLDIRTNARQSYKKEECPERDLRVVALNLAGLAGFEPAE